MKFSSSTNHMGRHLLAMRRVTSPSALAVSNTTTASPDFLRPKLTSYKLLKLLELVKAVPKSPSGKILRLELLRMELEKHATKM